MRSQLGKTVLIFGSNNFKPEMAVIRNFFDMCGFWTHLELMQWNRGIFQVNADMVIGVNVEIPKNVRKKNMTCLFDLKEKTWGAEKNKEKSKKELIKKVLNIILDEMFNESDALALKKVSEEYVNNELYFYLELLKTYEFFKHPMIGGSPDETWFDKIHISCSDEQIRIIYRKLSEFYYGELSTQSTAYSIYARLTSMVAMRYIAYLIEPEEGFFDENGYIENYKTLIEQIEEELQKKEQRQSILYRLKARIRYSDSSVVLNAFYDFEDMFEAIKKEEIDDVFISKELLELALYNIHIWRSNDNYYYYIEESLKFDRFSSKALFHYAYMNARAQKNKKALKYFFECLSLMGQEIESLDYCHYENLLLEDILHVFGVFRWLSVMFQSDSPGTAIMYLYYASEALEEYTKMHGLLNMLEEEKEKQKKNHIKSFLVEEFWENLKNKAVIKAWHELEQEIMEREKRSKLKYNKKIH